MFEEIYRYYKEDFGCWIVFILVVDSYEVLVVKFFFGVIVMVCW